MGNHREEVAGFVSYTRQRQRRGLVGPCCCLLAQCSPESSVGLRACEASGPGCCELQQDQKGIHWAPILPLSATRSGKAEGEGDHVTLSSDLKHGGWQDLLPLRSL